VTLLQEMLQGLCRKSKVAHHSWRNRVRRRLQKTRWTAAFFSFVARTQCTTKTMTGLTALVAVIICDKSEWEVFGGNDQRRR